VDYALEYSNSTGAHLTAEEVDRQLEELPKQFEQISFEAKYATSFSNQLSVLSERSRFHFYRNPSYTGLKLLMGVIVAVIVASFSVRKGWESGDYVRSKVDLIFMGIACLFSVGVITVIPVAVEARAVFYREKACTMYTPWAYTTSTMIAELPYIWLQTTLFVVPFYFILGLNNNVSDFFWFYFTCGLFNMMGIYVGDFAAALLPTTQLATIIGIGVFACIMLFSGYTMSPDAMPSFWTFMYYLMPGQYVMSTVVHTQVGNHGNTMVKDAQLPGDTFCAAVCSNGISESFKEPCNSDGICTPVGLVFGPGGQMAGMAERPYSNIFIIVLYVVYFRFLGGFSYRYINHQLR